MPKLTQEFIDGLVTDRDKTFFDTVQVGFAIRVLPTGVKTYVVKASVGGLRRKVTIGNAATVTLAAARREAREALDAIRRGADPAKDKADRRRALEYGAISIADLADRWMQEVVRPKRKPRTIADYERIIAKQIKPALGNVLVQELAWEEVNKFHGSMARTPRRANYVVSTLRAMLNFAERIGLRPPHSNPCEGVEFFRETQRERFLSEAEIGAAADAIESAERDGVIGPHAAAGLRLALFSGARSGEITAIQWQHVDWNRKLVRLPDSKTNDPRTIHLSDAALEVLKTLPRVGPFVIAGAKPGEAYKNLGRAWITTREYAGLQDVRLHDLRHSYASLAAGRGVSLQMIGKLLGHKVAATTMRYAHLARSQASAVNDELGAAMTAAIEKAKTPAPPNVVKLKQPRKPARSHDHPDQR
jgi:integrase